MLLKLICGVCLILVSSLVIVAQNSVLPKISVSGNQFITPDGESFVFKGVSTSDPDKLHSEGKWNKSYFEEIQSWGANVVRLPIHPRAWRKQGKDEYLRLLDQAVSWSSELGMYLILDWHSIGNLRTEMFQAPGYETTQKETFEFWRTLAGHFKDNTTVAFFELFNEPTTYQGQLATCTWEEWERIVLDIITIIRSNGSEAIPLVGGWDWAYDLTPVRENPIDAKGIAYVSHPYPQKRSKPWEKKWTADWGFVAENYPIILTEIGFCHADERGAHIPVISDETYGEAIIKYCKDRGISWVAWVFDPHWSPMLFYDWSYRPTPQGKFFKKVMSEKNE